MARHLSCPRRYQRKAVRVLGFSVVVALCVWAAGWLGEWPGGMRSNYRAVDFERRLTGVAKSALPLADAIQRYYVSHGHLPEDLAPIRDILTAQGWQASDLHQFEDWRYVVSPGTASFSLTRKLGWDPSLRYTWKGGEGSWHFNPGNGTPERLIELKP